MNVITDYDFDTNLDDEEICNNNLTAYDIAVFYNTYNLSALLNWWDTKIIVPDFQRSYVWDIKQASQFIDSILRGLPIPSIFLYDDRDNNKLLVVDGQQRLTSLYRYIKEEKFRNKRFALTGQSIYKRWANKTYAELDQNDKETLNDVLLNATVMRQISPDIGRTSMYLVFQRINTGGSKLNPQEIRMAVSYGKLSKLLSEFALDESFDKWNVLYTKNAQEENNRSSIQEFVLKIYAYFFRYIDSNWNGNGLRSFLDDFFDEQRDFDELRKKKPTIKYHNIREFYKINEIILKIVKNVEQSVLAPDEKPTQSFACAVIVGILYRVLYNDNSFAYEKIEFFINKWKNELGKIKIKDIFLPRRTSVTTIKTMIDASVNYFAKL